MNVADTWAAIRGQFAGEPRETAKGRIGRPTRFPNITAYALELRVDPSHLRRVLCGSRSSESLMARLRAMKHPLLQFVPQQAATSRRKAS